MKCLGKRQGTPHVYCTKDSIHPAACYDCGWEYSEAERRRRLPLTKGEDGLLRKVLRRRK